VTAESEFSIIRELFAPLAKTAAGAFSLTDDVAAIDLENAVITKDLMIAGVHFRQKDPLDLVARKLMRVNISDLVSKGVRPAGYLLGCVWPANTDRAMIETFVSGLKQDQKAFKCHLLGGDTTRHRLKTGPLTLSATFYGPAPDGGIIRRSGANVGEDVYVTGTIGDGALGLRVLEAKLKVSEEDKAFLQDRYWLPQPRVTFGTALGSFATAAMDISDGLITDAGHLATQSEVGVSINLDNMPLSVAAHKWLQEERNKQSALEFLATGGDDYEILFTAPSSMRRSIHMASRASRTDVTRIGRTTREKIILVACGDKETEVKAGGFDHFSVS